jgi:hypothetical protein
MNQASTFLGLLVNFSPMFTAPSFNNFVSIACGWVLCVGRRTISRVIQVEGLDGAPRHHSVFYRFFSRANFFPTDLGQYVLALVLELLPENARIVLTVDP